MIREDGQKCTLCHFLQVPLCPIDLTINDPTITICDMTRKKLFEKIQYSPILYEAG